ncbi:hypothetical protein EBA01_20835 [Xanthomonas oryzae pv. oryzae]|nr:hypothetical protein C0L89_20845 [Xanthomonas oryzae pv. oryzae]AVU04304.1 hypothetical protein C0L90_20880 [Xanthomonas oryzae pv. oryzae]QBN29946.1 hypothetical protein EBA01_20835 [Xanthomonas oryzae pv. oryzae]QBN33569.1 hypothetical protein EBA02_20805 [Xanthomonas oryzae pv. oryzae]QBN44464.1 hypothetical protein EBA05_20930 [Xanthomonas oryzae pv. oryzae]
MKRAVGLARDFQRSAATAGCSAPSRRVGRGTRVAVTLQSHLPARRPGMAMPGRDGFFVGLPTMMRDNPCAATIPSVHRNPARPCARLVRACDAWLLKAHLSDLHTGH